MATLQLSAQQGTYRHLDSCPGFHSFLYLLICLRHNAEKQGFGDAAARPSGTSERPCPVTPEGALGKLQVAVDPGLQSPWPGTDPQGLQGPLKGLNQSPPHPSSLLSPSVGLWCPFQRLEVLRDFTFWGCCTLAC